MTTIINSNGVKEEPEEEDLFFEADEESDEDDNGDGDADSNNETDLGIRLTTPIIAQYSCDSLFKMVKGGNIDLEADYQRDVVWTAEKQSTLIDSIYRNYYIPPILFSLRKVQNEDGDTEESRICIDGKQRLTSICRFMNNEIPMRNPRNGKTLYYNLPGSKARSMTQAKRDNFSKIQVVCVEYKSLTDDIERDMFHRVQLGMYLSSGEKLGAEKGPWADFARELMKRLFDLAPPLEDPKHKPWRRIVRFERGKDFLLMAYTCLLYLNRDQYSFVPSAVALQDLFKKRDLPPTDSQKKELINAVIRWANMAKSEEYNVNLLKLKSAKGKFVLLSPMEFIFTVYMCHRYPGASDSRLSHLFGEMRRNLRSQHKDIMINKSNEVTIRAYLREVEYNHPSYLSPNGSRKRNREAGDDEEGEWQPPGQEYSRQRTN